MTTTGPAPGEALSEALQRVLQPLARLALSRGVTHAALDDLLKQVLVVAADEQLSALPPHRRVSRITTATGIHRREVTRLVDRLRLGEAPGATAAPRSHANVLFEQWRHRERFCDRNGSPLELPRTPPVGVPATDPRSASFEELAQSVTRDVHPRSLLDELVRLGIAALDAQRDTVRLVREAFVPHGDEGRLVQVLGRNVGAHLEAAVDNVLVDDHNHFEQALYASGLSDEAMVAFRRLVQDQWQALTTQLVPALRALVADSAQAAAEGPAGPAADGPAGAATASAAPVRHRVRIGLYTHSSNEPPSPLAKADTDPSRP